VLSSVYVGSRRVDLSPAAQIGTGGEADVYSIGGGEALKVYKSPDHPDIVNAPPPADPRQLAKEAAERIETAQRKLRDFPTGLPLCVLAPRQLACETPHGTIVGYTMAYVHPSELLFYYGKPGWCEREHIDPNDVTGILLDLHQSLRQLHRAGVVVGDYSDLNVLVQGKGSYMVDADSFQYGPYVCRTYQARFVDPMHCDLAGPHPVMVRPHDESSDWYAFAVMVTQCLLKVDPYGGVYREPGRKVTLSDRMRRRITLFGGGARPPHASTPLDRLPHDLQGSLRDIFKYDTRGEFPRASLEALRWRTCPKCTALHARPDCPECGTVVRVRPPRPVPVGVTVRSVKEGPGRVVAASVRGGKLLYLYESESGHGGVAGRFLRRESGEAVLAGWLPAGVKVRLRGDETWLARDGTVREVWSNNGVPEVGAWSLRSEVVGADTAFDCNERLLYTIEDGRLVSYERPSPVTVGGVLRNQTRIWVGEELGFGFYRAGGLSGALMWSVGSPGINDRVPLELPSGQLLDATCVFGRGAVFFLAQAREGAQVVNTCTLYDGRGTMLARERGVDGDGTWLGTLRGKTAVGGRLLCATDGGIVRVDETGGRLDVAREYPETARWVHGGSHLFAGPTELYVITGERIDALRLV
jgi:hypothetical protein